MVLTSQPHGVDAARRRSETRQALQPLLGWPRARPRYQGFSLRRRRRFASVEASRSCIAHVQLLEATGARPRYGGLSPL